MNNDQPVNLVAKGFVIALILLAPFWLIVGLVLR